MKEGVKKSISLILVLTLLVQLLPVVAFGVGDETNDLDISTDSETVSMKDDDAEIVGEEDALREESVKHFRLRDGGYMLVEYETAVHYQTADGSWEEIDNTLQKTGQQYVAQAGDMTRKFAASLDSGFLFETAYQGQSVSMSLARRSSRDVVAVAPDVPAAEETAAPEETVAPETVDQPQEAEQTEADLPRASAEAAAETDAPQQETDAPQQETAEELPLLDDAAYTLVTSTAAARMENPGAKMRTFSKLAEKDKIQPQKIRSSVAFDNVMDGVSLLYQNYGYNVKESIIIDKQQDLFCLQCGIRQRQRVEAGQGRFHQPARADRHGHSRRRKPDGRKPDLQRRPALQRDGLRRPHHELYLRLCRTPDAGDVCGRHVCVLPVRSGERDHGHAV